MNNTITAQELKTRGSQILEEKTKKDKEAFITVRGEKSYVVLTISKYNYLRDCELEAALKESEADLAAGRFKIMTPEEHIKALKNV
jgi:PHD/YefM family antitoxin component YafN of YafNO toxin-antitoxin module